MEGPREEPKTAATGIPMPRARPVVADVAVRPETAPAQDSAARADDRTLMQKLSDLLPGRVTLASLVTGGGLLRRGPDLAALGYDSSTAVYDIPAHAVYLPNGLSLEAHSGMGALRDDPEHIAVPMAGATPPAVYDLKPREKLFHGVQAVRMIPTEGSDVSGRSGLLVHSFMLGPKGDFKRLRLDQGLRPVPQGVQRRRDQSPCRRPELERRDARFAALDLVWRFELLLR